jgi:hypothetical protein
MKRFLSAWLSLGLLSSAARAGPTETAIIAVMRLSEQLNYSWVATVSDDARTYDIHGKATRGSFTAVKMPAINSIRRQLGRSVTDTHIEMIFLGNVNCVIETDKGWLRPEELPPAISSGNDSLHPAGNIGAPTSGGTRSRLGITSRTRHHGSGSSGPKSSADRSYSNLQLAISHPHEELGVIVGSHQEFNVEGDVVTGTLTDLGAQLLLVRDGQDSLTPVRATGSFKLWLRDGAVVKYQVKVQGTLRVELSSGHREINVQQTTDTLIKEVGTTRFEVPAEARRKLGTE